MARMYSRNKGKSGSERPLNRESPEWVTLSSAEVEKLVKKLSSEGVSPAQIGLRLRDEYGVPDVKALTGKRLSSIIESDDEALPHDLSDLVSKAKQLKTHLLKSRKDLSAKRGLDFTEAKIRKLGKYYVSSGKLPKSWKYTKAMSEVSE
ncbi:MAG: 30S ribosomal protein S15 [archaeon]|jgi:small subunit ribosomal protein S15|nr:30S ribosomal protein S15 [Euryarchaeota archaeon]MDP6704556.1 30S ribosomal protein S15 [archaeon]MDP7260529.1 30S ribosomal protein S15 [archaeon]HIK01214.1 30S ribosomal protein S15 [Candidatus Undinarchaeales archaeon ERR594346 U_76725]|tara:strand:- start:32113 stop:32559 length:447 start_codon:yes stop_codon:yes gene_type:complete